MNGYLMDRAQWEAVVTDTLAFSKPVQKPLWRKITSNLGLLFIGAYFFDASMRQSHVGVWPTLGVIVSAIIWKLFWSGPVCDQRARWLALDKHGFPICLGCGYNLQGTNRDGPCPECGWRREQK